MIRGLKGYLCFTLLLSSVLVRGQVFYSTDPAYLRAKTEQNNLISAFENSYPDTNLTSFSNYHPRNFLGNTGLSNPDYFLRYGTPGLGFIFFRPPHHDDRFPHQNVEYYRSRGPYADFTGIAGNKELQIFRARFTHTYREKVNIGLKFNRYTSTGFYSRQQTYSNNFFLSSNYQSADSRFGFYFYFINNSNKNNENGGLQAGRLTDSTALARKEILRINIRDANRDNRENRAMINPYYRLNKKADSTQPINHYLQLKSSFSDNRFQYLDDASGSDNFYSNFYYDTVQTRDSSHHRQFLNELAYTGLTRGGGTAFSAGYRHEINQTWQFYDTVLFNHLVFGDLGHQLHLHDRDSSRKRIATFENMLSGQYVVTGSNEGNFKIEGRTSFSMTRWKAPKLRLSVLYESRTPDHYFLNWYSNHFAWSNRFKPVQTLQYRVALDVKKALKISYTVQNSHNYVYAGYGAVPESATSMVSREQLMLMYQAVFFRHLGVQLTGMYQRTNREDIVRQPGTTAFAKLFYTGNLFRNNLQLQLGGELQSYGEFTPYAYMPATQAFFLQDNFQTGQYPYLDIFLSARIRPVSFFLRMENVLHGLVENNHSLVAGYYQPERAFRFGLSWMFFD